MLVSCVVSLIVKEEVLVPPSMGQVLHAFFLDRVRALEPGLSEMLHGQFPVKPFTVSPLWGMARKSTAQKNGQSLSLDVEPEITNDCTFVPLHFVVEVKWDDWHKSLVRR